VASIKDNDKDGPQGDQAGDEPVGRREMLQAVQLATSWSNRRRSKASMLPCPSSCLAGQDYRSLRKMLDVTRQAQQEALAEMKSGPAATCPTTQRRS